MSSCALFICPAFDSFFLLVINLPVFPSLAPLPPFPPSKTYLATPRNTTPSRRLRPKKHVVAARPVGDKY